jgi:hypothetical protein
MVQQLRQLTMVQQLRQLTMVQQLRQLTMVETEATIAETRETAATIAETKTTEIIREGRRIFLPFLFRVLQKLAIFPSM